MRKDRGENFLNRWILKNGSYKVVALFVTLVLWITILGRKDFKINHEVKLNVKISENMEMYNFSEKIVKVKVGGPRLALKRFTDSNSKLILDLTKMGPGRSSIRLQESDFVLPKKVRIISIVPGFISLDVRVRQ